MLLVEKCCMKNRKRTTKSGLIGSGTVYRIQLMYQICTKGLNKHKEKRST